MAGATYTKPDFPATGWDPNRGQGPSFFGRPHPVLLTEGGFPAGLSQQDQAGYPSWAPGDNNRWQIGKAN